nr:hypothetical protein [Candidatus Gracilibacteria bacterium]
MTSYSALHNIIKKIIYIFFISFLFVLHVNAVTTSLSYVGTATDIGGGTYAWTNPTNAVGNTTTTAASVAMTTRNNSSNNLSLTNFNLAGAGLPFGSVINGIQVQVERNVSNTRGRDTTVQLTKDGTTFVGTNMALNANGPTAKTLTTYGGLTNLWGTTWTSNDLLSSNFGVILGYTNNNTILGGSITANVYRVIVTVDYTPNNPPTDITLSNQSIASGFPIGTNIGSLSTTDADVSDTHTYSFGCSIPGVDDSSFIISGNQLNSNQVFDYNTKSSYNICIRTDDGRGGTFDKNFTITITPPIPNNPPTNITLSNQSILEKIAIGSLVGSLTTTDPDAIDTHTYSFGCSVSGADDSSFSLSGSDLLSNQVFDFNVKSTYNICIRTDDGRGGTFDKNFTINILQNLNFLYAGTATDIGGGTFSWTNPTNAVGNTTTTAATSTISTRNAYSNYISLTNFGINALNIPSNAIIDGVQFDVERNVSNTRMRDTTAQLTLDGTNVVGSNYGANVNGPTAKTISVYGGSANTWGVGLTPAIISSPNFGLILQYRFTTTGTASVNVYRVKVTVTYHIPISPGGVSSNLSIWLKADKGTSTTTDGASLATWNDQSGNGFNAGGGVSPIYLNNTNTGNLNFNPIINFDGTQYLENLSNGSNSKSYFMVIVPNNQIDGTLSGQVPFAFDCLSGILSSGTCGLSFAGTTLGAFTVAMNDEVITHALGSSANWRSAQIGAYSYSSGRPMLIGINENSLANGTDIYEKGTKVDNFTANTYQTLATADYRLGMTLDGANPFPYNGKIAEIINYSSRISDIDRQKIESYLALKYGITLNGGTENYLASDGTIIWGTGIAGTFVNGIFGIGRDDFSDLGQVKSKSENVDGIITLNAIGEGTNMTPSFVDIADKEFLVISNDGGGNTWVQTGAPTGYDILVRKWKIQELGNVGTVSLDFDVANPNFDVPLLSTGSNYYFIYDSNSNGSLSDETPVVMTNTIGNIWQVSGISLLNGQKFTIASQASSNNIPTNITLSNNIINENVASGTTIGTLTTTDADVLDTHTYSFVIGVGDTDNSLFSLSGNILKIAESPDYEIQNSYSVRIQTDDGHGGQFQKQFIINVNDIGETINSILDFEIPGKYTVTSGNWTRTTTNPQQGIYSIESNNGGLPNTQSCFEVTNTFYTGTGTVEFQYNVSSQAGGDFLRFYIDNVEQQAWSGTVPWTLYSKNNVPVGTHQYKWCYLKDGTTNAGTDNAFIDYITYAYSAVDNTPPSITSINYASGTLLPGGNHNLIINYNDMQSGINTSSDIISLYKWNGTSWGTDISATGINLAGKTVTPTQAIYPTNNLTYGKYMYNFQISDNSANSSSTGAVFYVDEPEIIISTGTLNMGVLSGTGLNFSGDEIIITINTVGAGFQVNMVKDTNFQTQGGASIIIDWDGSLGVGYDKSPYIGVIKNINNYPVIGSGSQNININGFKNIYTYNIKIGDLIDLEQAAGIYTMNLSFIAIFNY